MLFQPADLLGDGTPHRQVAGMQAGNIMAGHVGGHIFSLDFVERHRRGIDQLRSRRAMLQQFRRDDGAGVETDRATRQEPCATQRDEVGRTWPGADEMDGHGASPLMAMAQVTGPSTVRGPSSVAPLPATARAEASETDGVPASSRERLELVSVPGEAACRAASSTMMTGRFSLRPAAAM